MISVVNFELEMATCDEQFLVWRSLDHVWKWLVNMVNFKCCRLTWNPWMALNFGNCWPVIWVVTEHFTEKIFEVWSELTFLVDFLPVLVILSSCDHSVEWVINWGLCKWEVAFHDNEKKDTGWKDVGHSSIILFTFSDFWGSIWSSSTAISKITDVFRSS